MKTVNFTTTVSCRLTQQTRSIHQARSARLSLNHADGDIPSLFTLFVNYEERARPRSHVVLTNVERFFMNMRSMNIFDIDDVGVGTFRTRHPGRD